MRYVKLQIPSVEEGLTRLGGGYPTKQVSEAVTSLGSGLQVISEDARLVEKLPMRIKRPLEVRFFLRYSHLEVAFVPSPDQLSKVQGTHEQIRKDYGPKLGELIARGNDLQKRVAQFINQLGSAVVDKEKHCLDCPPSA